MGDMNISIPPALEDWVETRLAEGRYLDAGDYVRDLMRRDRERTEDENAWLKQLADEGRASGIIEMESEDVIEKIISDHPANRD
ncbi:ribbon-helix-helix domain-containing protein [Novosphingopyxis iocasae]|uniref:ribbon-helix-helix domain-containing protein n=1 Tax=Novosphingopyxis iocasae TaxID=2762729 RepID=UPI0016514410|nr:type II toxin-antitoxin system ParD family antitoxin [Novosphingopyxis iocasae]